MLKKINALNRIVCCSLFLMACNSKDNNKVAIQFAKDSASIVITNITPAGYLILEDRYKKGLPLTGIISVLESPGVDDSLSMEHDFPGKVLIKNKKAVFMPDQPFIKGKTYIVSTSVNAGLGGSAEAFSNKLNARTAPYQKTLVR